MIFLYLSFIYPFAFRYLSFCDPILYLSILGFRLRKYKKIKRYKQTFIAEWVEDVVVELRLLPALLEPEDEVDPAVQVFAHNLTL